MPARQLRSLDRIGVPIREEHEGLLTAEDDDYDLVVDAVSGGLFLADIGVRPALYREGGTALQIRAVFTTSDLRRIW